jgi:U3 small nucleolar RNA-associated protein 19
MPSLTNGDSISKKRKRIGIELANGTKAKKVSKGDSVQKLSKAKRSKNEESEDSQEQIILLETQILESRKHYNNIAKLISTLQNSENATTVILAAAVSLCRVFCRLMAGGSMSNSKGMAENEAVIVDWLRARYDEYTEAVLSLLLSPQMDTHVCIYERRSFKSIR